MLRSTFSTSTPEEAEDAEDIAEEDALMDEVNAATPVDGEDPSTDLPDNEEESANDATPTDDAAVVGVD